MTRVDHTHSEVVNGTEWCGRLRVGNRNKSIEPSERNKKKVRNFFENLLTNGTKCAIIKTLLRENKTNWVETYLKIGD